MWLKYQVIHPHWLREYLDERARHGLRPDVRIVPPGEDGAPPMSKEDFEAGCVVIACD